MTNVLLFKDLHEYLTNLGFIPDRESISRLRDDSNLMDTSEWPHADKVDLYGEDMLLYGFKDEIAVNISLSIRCLHCYVRSSTLYDYDDSEDGEIDEFDFESMDEFIDKFKFGLCCECGGGKNKYMEEAAEYPQADSDYLNRMSKAYDIIEELYKKVSNTKTPKSKEENIMGKTTIKEFAAFVGKIGFTPDPLTWNEEPTDQDVFGDDAFYWFDSDIDKHVRICAADSIQIESDYITDVTLAEFDTGIENMKINFMKALLSITSDFNKAEMYKQWGCAEGDLKDYSKGLGDPNYTIDPFGEEDWFENDTLWGMRKQADNLFDWALEIFNRLAKLEVPLGELPDIKDPDDDDDADYDDGDGDDEDTNEEDTNDDDTEASEWAESLVEMAEDNIANGMPKEDAYKDAVSKALTSAMTGIPPSLQDLLGKLAANGTQIHGVGPGGCVINVGADGSTTTVGGTDITGLFKQKPDIEAKPLEGFPYMGTPHELSDKFKANIRPRLRDKAKVLGTDEDELLEIYASNIPKSVLGIFHQLVQSSHDTEDIISIEKWFNHNGREGLLMSADTDGTTVNSIGSIPFTDYVVNEEVFNGVLKQAEELAARNPDYGYDKATKDFRHNK